MLWVVMLVCAYSTSSYIPLFPWVGDAWVSLLKLVKISRAALTEMVAYSLTIVANYLAVSSPIGSTKISAVIELRS
jgi:hypothetical protein